MEVFRNVDAKLADLPGHHVYFVLALTLECRVRRVVGELNSSEMGRMGVES